MNIPELIDATLNADGTLELDHVPIVPPGRVRVSVQPLAGLSLKKPGLVDNVDAIKQIQRAR